MATPSSPLDPILLGRDMAREMAAASYERSAISDDKYGRYCIAYANSGAEVQRRIRARARRRMARDGWRGDLADDLRTMISSELHPLIIGPDGRNVNISFNPFKDITTELRSLYQQPPVRRDDDEEIADEDAEARESTSEIGKFQEATRGTKLHSFWQRAELALEQQNVVGLWPTVRDGKLRHRLLLPDVMSVVMAEDDPTKVEAATLIDYVPYLDGKAGFRYHVVTDDWLLVFDERGKRLFGGDIPEDGVNPYGIIPITFWRLFDDDDQFWEIDAGEDLVSLTRVTGRLLTLTDYLWLMSSHKQLLVMGDKIRTEAKTLADPAAFIKLQGDGLTAQIVDWQVDFMQRLDYVLRMIGSAAQQRGIRNAEKYDSGLKLRIGERGLVENRNRKREGAVEADQDYVRRLRIVAKRHGIDAGDPEAEPEIVHAPVEYPTDPKVQLEVFESKIALGLANQIDYVHREHPDWTRERCTEEVKRNFAAMAQIAVLKRQANIPEVPSNQDRVAEDTGQLGPIVRDLRHEQVTPPSPGSAPGNQTSIAEDSE